MKLNHKGTSVIANQSLIYMNYSEIDLMQLVALRLDISSKGNRKIRLIDLDVLLSTFDGQTVFSMCFDEISFYDYIYSRLEDSEYAEKDGKDE